MATPYVNERVIREEGAWQQASLTGMHRYFERQCDKEPNSVALICHDKRLNYAELDVRANRLAH